MDEVHAFWAQLIVALGVLLLQFLLLCCAESAAEMELSVNVLIVAQSQVVIELHFVGFVFGFLEFRLALFPQIRNQFLLEAIVSINRLVALQI